ncbi:MAG: MBL fold metallo-hydrolase, partial [Desulfobacterales bacterium]
TLKSLPVDHNPESLAYRITDARGRAVVYTGDSDVCENLVAIARNADLFICESSLPDAQKVDGHLTPSLAGEMATRATVGRLVLTHFYPECDEADIEKECRKTFSGPLVLARDLMRFKLS